MRKLGADYRTRKYEAGRYIERLESLPSCVPLSDWRSAIGVPSKYPGLRLAILGEIEKVGSEAVLRALLPEFIGGIALQAFHPLIRIAYGIEDQNDQEIAAGLSYLVTEYRPTPQVSTGRIDLRAFLLESANNEIVASSSESTFTQSVLSAVRGGRYFNAGASTIGECASVSIDIFRSSRDFFALHFVTATHAMRICRPYIDERVAEAALTGALISAYDIIGAPRFSPDAVSTFP